MIAPDKQWHAQATPSGADHPGAALSWDQVREIRSLFPSLNNKQISEKMNLDAGLVWRVTSGRSYVERVATGNKSDWLKSKIEASVSMEPNSGCWIWLFGAVEDGYGIINFDGATKRSHRTAFEAYKHEIPRGMCVCHRCDTPSCCNPDHLFLGTHGENNADRGRKGRGSTARGSEMKHSKLNDELVRLIRADRRHQRVIAKEYGFSQAVIWAVRARKTWAHVS